MVDVRISDLAAAPASAVADTALLEMSTGSGGNSYALSIGAVKAWFAGTFAQVAGAGGAAPAMDGAAAVGASAYAARADHVHPTDASRAKAGANGDITSVRLGVTPTYAAGSAAPAVSYGTIGGGQAANFAACAPGSAQGQAVGYDFYPTFMGTGDNGPRRAAQIRGRFNGGAWGTETLEFLVGSGGALNDAGNLDNLVFSLSGTGASPNPLPVSQGGTGAATPLAACNSIGAAVDADLRYLFLKTSALAGTQLGMVDGIVDPLSNLADVNTAASTGYSFNQGAGTISLAPSVGSQFVSVSTSSQAISGGDTNTSYQCGYAFDGTYSSYWSSSQSGANVSGAAWIGQDFGLGNAFAVGQLCYVASPQGPNYNISSVILQYADTSGTTLGPWTSGGTYAVSNAALGVTVISVPTGTGAHRAWRLLANANPGGSYGWNVSELSMQVGIVAGTNVATAAQAIGDSSSSSSYPVTGAFDGVLTTCWQTGQAAGSCSGIAWIGQDFGPGNAAAIAQMLYITSSTAGEAPAAVLLQYADTAAGGSGLGGWTTVGAYAVITTASSLNVLAVPSTAGAHRAWRLLANANCASYPWAVVELQMLTNGILVATTPAYGAPIDGGNSGGNYTASAAFDSNASTYWVSSQTAGSVSGNAFIGMDYGAGNAYPINQLVLTPYAAGAGSNGESSFLIQYADVAGSWTTAYTVTGAAQTGTSTFTWASAGAHRFWRLLAAVNLTSGNPWAVTEVVFQVLSPAPMVQASRAGAAISGGDGASNPVVAAFDGNPYLSSWISSQTSPSGAAYLGQDFGTGSAVAPAAFSVTQATAGNSVASVLLQYADTSGGALGPWTTASAYVLNTSACTTCAVPPSAGAHRAWRLLANANTSSGNGWQVLEAVFYVATPAITGFALQSAALASAVASPSTARVFVQVDATSAAFTPNTDLVASFSRDGGTTFVGGALALVETLTDGTSLYDTGSFSLSGAPVGNATMTYRIASANSKAVVLTGVGMQVRP